MANTIPAWRSRMAPARFRGVSFHVDTAERSGGRRTVVHEYPFRDAPFVDDLGKKRGAYPVEGHVIGSDYLEKRDALITALETEGSGELVHPYYGTVRVICSGFSVRESTEQGGVAHFSITFDATTADSPFPASFPDPTAKLLASAQLADLGFTSEFEAVYNVASMPSHALASVTGILQRVSGALDAAMAPVIATEKALASFKQKTAALISKASSLIHAPESLVAAVQDAISPIVDLVNVAGNALATLSAVDAILLSYKNSAATSGIPPSTTPTRQQELANFNTTQQMIQRMILTQAARVAVAGTYDSFEAAVARRELIVEALDEQIDLASDDIYPRLLQVRADLVKAVPGSSSDLAHLVTHTPAFTMPSLVMAYRLYGDVAQEADVVTRNRIRHPGFVAGGRPLEVLSHAS